MNEVGKARLGLLAVLAERAPAGHIGRTALMKYMYFLQTLRGVRLDYDFSLYSYGPFDSEVLADLEYAEASQVVTVTPVEFVGGYGYEIRPGGRADSAKREAAGFLGAHEHDINWLFSSFGAFNSAQLELASTIVYVDRELAKVSLRQSCDEMTARVSEIKPHFSDEQIHTYVDRLLDQRVLSTVTHRPSSGRAPVDAP